ncbi:MAG: hypothetical protein U0R65_07535 [Candidatus Nanopelagicales bacterium]
MALLADLVVAALRGEDVDTGSTPAGSVRCGDGCCPGTSARASVGAC